MGNRPASASRFHHRNLNRTNELQCKRATLHKPVSQTCTRSRPKTQTDRVAQKVSHYSAERCFIDRV